MNRLCRLRSHRVRLNSRSFIKTNRHQNALDTHLLEKITMKIAHCDQSVLISKPPAKLVENLYATTFTKWLRKEQTAAPPPV